jgi:diguanylate cyclase (GGDEF)-like protein
MDSNTGLIIQLAGIILMAALSFFLTRSLKSIALKYWCTAWFSLSFALLSLALAFTYETFDKPLLAFYFFGEYVFCFLLIAGCQNYASDERLPLQNWRTLVPFAILSLILSLSVTDINEIFNIHSFVLGTSFLFSFIAIKSVRKSRQNNYGWYVMRTALAMLATGFYSYVVASTLHLFAVGNFFTAWFLAHHSLFDLVLEILLGFGMVIVLLEEVRQDLEAANEKLKVAHAKLEEAALTDPLTTAFNRHAFYGFLNKNQPVVSGCVGVFDIDNLKPINDRYGHLTGDMAIRAAARSIRLLIRAEDLIFRWGGDEFFVIMLGMDSEMARGRMIELKELLSNIRIDGVTERLTIGVSFGFADFSGMAELEQAVKDADAEMYRLKQENKLPEKTEQTVFLPAQDLSSEKSEAIC